MRIQQDINFPSKQIFRVLVEQKAPLCQVVNVYLKIIVIAVSK